MKILAAYLTKSWQAYVFSVVLFFSTVSCARDSIDVSNSYLKYEYQIPMRDGVKLFTAVYIPQDTSVKYPILLNRTPYNVRPYGTDAFPEFVGPSEEFTKEGYIFVYQDVRGRFMSEGEFVDMRPFIKNKKSNTDVDESSDTYDTIEWLLKNIEHHNGRVGMWGISYPGFYTAMGAVEAHPALVAVSPQAPIADWFIGDDFHHNGAFFLPHAFNFYAVFGIPRTELTMQWPQRFQHGTPDGYKFFLEMGPLKNTNEKYFNYKISFWNEVLKHGTYDEFWKSRNTLQHLTGIEPAVMTVGGWFDAENLYGALNTYKAIEKKNPGAYNILVMGPWYHGAWARSNGDKLGDISFGSQTSSFYQNKIELPFFNYYLKNKGELSLPEAYVFETGSNEWKSYNQWPPSNVAKRELFFNTSGSLSFEALTSSGSAFNEFLSDPGKPVPYTQELTTGMIREYMVEDQRFAARRPDVLVYESEKLKDNLTIAGPIEVELYVSTTGTDADWIVKVIDVFPDDFKYENQPTDKMGGYQMMIRGDIMRGKFRNSYEMPEQFKPNEIAKVKFRLNDVNHSFLKGHRIMVQVQSSWFPLADRNPQKFVDIYSADGSDFQKAFHRLYCSKEFPSKIVVGVIK